MCLSAHSHPFYPTKCSSPVHANTWKACVHTWPLSIFLETILAYTCRRISKTLKRTKQQEEPCLKSSVYATRKAVQVESALMYERFTSALAFYKFNTTVAISHWKLPYFYGRCSK